MKKQIEMNYRTHGKMFEQFVQFCNQVSKGYTCEIHHPKYVVMDTKRYEQLLRRALTAETVIVQDEMKGFIV